VPYTSSSFDSYTIQYTSHPGPGYIAMINCYLAGVYKGSIRFYPDNVTLPPNFLTAQKQIVMHFPIRRFEDIITIIRYEKPLWILLFDDTLWGYLGTGSTEPVGEQET
jgi:hypothetical protein